MRNNKNYFVALLGGVLLWAAWPTSPLTFLIFIALVPMLWMADNATSGKKLFKVTYLHMFVWNALTTWWIYHATFAGAALAILANSLLMCVPWLLMLQAKKYFGRMAGFVALVAFWVSFEYLHHRWELSWPWLTLGNVFAVQPGWVQWYEATGTTGGTLWVLLGNIFCYWAFTTCRQQKASKHFVRHLVAFVMIVAVPLLLSAFIYNKKEPAVTASKSATKNVVVVQPNVDPYNEKFAAGTQEAQIQNLIALSEQQIDDKTTLVVWPETAIPVGVWEEEIQQNFYYGAVWAFLGRHPNISLLSGIDSYRRYGPDKTSATATARYSKEMGSYYDAFNTAAMLYPGQTARFYHKAKLVPGVETLPSFLLFIGSVFEDFGGTSGTLGRDKQRVVFPDKQHYFVAGPVICYESIYSDYITEYIRKGANLLTIVTNDGWWSDTQGYKQHMNYARLRAIETRRWVARSANTGISCFIDPLGNVYQPQPWDTKASIKMNIEPLQAQTFFVKHGDYLSRIINVVTAVFLVLMIIFKVRTRKMTKTAKHV